MKAPKLLAYLAHPVGMDRTLAEQAIRRDNIANALAWLTWLVDNTRWAVSTPWLPYVQVLSETTHRERGIDDNLASLERCDLIVLTGGRVSDGMEAERAHAVEHRIPVVDLTGWGFHAPDAAHTEEARAVLAMRLKRVTFDRPRRVWFPPLSVDQVGELRGNRAVLRSHEVDHDVLDAIIESAIGHLEP